MKNNGLAEVKIDWFTVFVCSEYIIQEIFFRWWRSVLFLGDEIMNEIAIYSAKPVFDCNRFKIRNFNYFEEISVDLTSNNEGLLKSAELGMNILIFLFY